jgi:hypothetical protein
MVKTKQAQIKIQQMIIMLLAVSLFFILIFLFYISIKFSNLEQGKIDLDREKAAGLVTKIASMPEISFGDNPRAIDADKLMMLKSFSEYRGFFGVKGVIIKKLPLTFKKVECSVNNYPECNLIKLFTTKDSAPTGSYVALCTKKTINDRAYNKCEVAYLMIDNG